MRCLRHDWFMLQGNELLMQAESVKGGLSSCNALGRSIWANSPIDTFDVRGDSPVCPFWQHIVVRGLSA